MARLGIEMIPAHSTWGTRILRAHVPYPPGACLHRSWLSPASATWQQLTATSMKSI